MTPKKQRVARPLLGLCAAFLLGIVAARGQTYSHARVVRLSFVEGDVTLQRPDLEEWAEAPMNTPLQEGFKLSTAEGSFAEVQFENGSTVRLGQLSLLEFTQLALASDGSKIDRLTLDNGYATFSANPEGQDVYEVCTSNSTLTPGGKAMFRVDLDSSGERVEVFHGSLVVAGSLGSWTLSKNSVLELSPGADQPAQLSEGITPDDWDRWVQDRESQEEAVDNGPPSETYPNNGSDTAYGWSDLAYYGNWSYLAGFGYGWTPGVNAGWYPYSLGRWCWYPGFGYTWISAEPWGWLPYHFGGWQFIPGIGWMWFPGNFGVWSPGLVTWYGGPGWIGWMPQSGQANGGKTNPCPQGQSCGIAVSTAVFRSGHPVGPATFLPVSVAGGKRMERPDVLPDRQAMLPGRAVAAPARFANNKVFVVGPHRAGLSSQTINPQPTPLDLDSRPASSLARGGSGPRFPGRHAAPGPDSGIVYDPAAGRYVNSSRLPSGAAQTPKELFVRPPPSPPGASASRALQPAPGTSSQENAPAAAPQSHGLGWFHHSSPGSESSPAAVPRSEASPAGGHATGSGNSSEGGARGASGSLGGGGGMSGGAHAGGGGMISGGGHR